jgi:hypothetical protein
VELRVEIAETFRSDGDKMEVTLHKSGGVPPLYRREPSTTKRS